MLPEELVDSPRRVIIEGVQPEIDGGRFPIKRAAGESVEVEADIFTDGHDIISAILLYRKAADQAWKGVFMKPLVNDRWRASFPVEEIGRYFYTFQAWVNPFMTWRRDLKKKVDAGQEVSADLLIGCDLVQAAAAQASGADQTLLSSWAEMLFSGKSVPEKIKLALDVNLARLVHRYPDRSHATRYAKKLSVAVQRPKARFSSWYEMFPRSCSGQEDRHGTFKDCEHRLAYIAEMGFDVLYLPPIHPIGRTHRKGKNNALRMEPDDPGSPWAIGASEGGHRAVHPQLGTLDDFRQFVSKAREFGIEVALDLAFQCTPDHPYVEKHPEWFYRRPDGTIQYAENPPKKYEDIYPLNFENDSWQDLWQEILGVVKFWIEQGIRIFRVDNPHTKPFAFWKWLIAEVKQDYPEIIFLAEAFTRPRVMYRLAKIGFTQSYTYFAWRNTKWELTEYFTELNRAPVREFFWPNLWPNTPDILTEYLQMGGRPAFAVRLVLAATLGANYGIYGPAFELAENRAREAHSEEYLNSEKYQIRAWDIERPDSLKSFIARVNRIRRENPALQKDGNLLFHKVDNEQLIAYSKHTGDLSNIVLVVVNLDPSHTHSGWLEFSPEAMGIDPQQSFQVHDLLSDARYLWQGLRNFVELNPQIVPAHIFAVRRKVRTERDFDYFL
ncbi:MAG: alpha-1,4-glucan--maltose-1-phosphate maltosyltransferase [Desulfobacterales bacterium]